MLPLYFQIFLQCFSQQSYENRNLFITDVVYKYTEHIKEQLANFTSHCGPLPAANSFTCHVESLVIPQQMLL